MLEELVNMSGQAQWSEGTEESNLCCEQGGERLVSRVIQTSGGKHMSRARSSGTCPTADTGFFSSMSRWDSRAVTSRAPCDGHLIDVRGMFFISVDSLSACSQGREQQAS